MRVKFNGGREASGILKGYDALLNCVLDGATEYLKGMIVSQNLVVITFSCLSLVVLGNINRAYHVS